MNINNNLEENPKLKPNPIETYTDDDESSGENEDFYFESDHLALRGNPDYTSVLKTMVILHTQKCQVLKDIELLSKGKKYALENPERFVEKLKKGEDLNLPTPINIAEIPKVNFEKYGISALTETVKLLNQPMKDVPLGNHSNADLTVRGRVFDQTKTETFNQLWTNDEQRRLEELLVEYPPEPIEMRRFAKIARALGNRTTKQVASRLQKYFKKLHTAGMPVPGRLPKSYRNYLSKVRSLKVRRPTTFFPENNVSIKFNDSELNDGSDYIESNYYRQGCSTTTSASLNSYDPNDNFVCTQIAVAEGDDESDNSEAGADDTIANNKELKIMKLINRIKKDKEIDAVAQRALSIHVEYTCDYCAEKPIYGTRWHCVTCQNESIDYCSDCLVSQLLLTNSITIKQHPIDHKFTGFRMVSSNNYLNNKSQSDFNSSSDNNDDDEMLTTASAAATL